MKSVLLQRSCKALAGLLLSCTITVTGLTAVCLPDSAAAAPRGKAIEVEATAYSPQDPGLSIWTATGTRLRKGVIAVDPDFIPLGSRVYIPDYGEAVAEDIGGAIVGDIIDIAFDTHAEALEFGRQYIVIYLLDEDEEAPADEDEDTSADEPEKEPTDAVEDDEEEDADNPAAEAEEKETAEDEENQPESEKE